MVHDKNKSPVGWYYGSYLLRSVELGDATRDDPARRFSSWENTVLVQASSLEAAFAKVERIGKENSRPYRGGPQGAKFRWEYMGVTELLPIYEKLQDGAEIAWSERSPRALKTLRSWVKPKSTFRQ
jgi:hypothetical protein